MVPGKGGGLHRLAVGGELNHRGTRGESEVRATTAPTSDFCFIFRAVTITGTTAQSLNLSYFHITYWITSSAR